MINFVIVEDNREILTSLKKVAIKASFNVNEEVRTECFTQYDIQLDNIIKDKALNKIFILDIEIPGDITGIGIAQKIRDIDINSPIIIVTSHDSLFETVYRTLLNIFDFIEKIGDYKNALEEDLKVIISKNYDNGSLKFTNRNICLQLKYSTILYIYRDTTERKIVIKADNNEYIVPLTLIDVTKLLDSRFKQVHRACIVNTDRVNKYYWAKGYFITDSNEKVDMLSKKYRGGIDHE